MFREQWRARGRWPAFRGKDDSFAKEGPACDRWQFFVRHFLRAVPAPCVGRLGVGRAASLLRRLLLLLAAVFSCGQGVAGANAAQRALAIGVDDYSHVSKLRGAGADARDVAQALRRQGVSQVDILLDRAATRKAVLAALDRLAKQTRQGDTVFIVFAGEGSSEPERIGGSRPDGKDAVYLLQKFNPDDRDGASEKILDTEIDHYVQRIEAAGGKAIVILDACSSAGAARAADPRSGTLAYRFVSYPRVADHIAGVAMGADAFLRRRDFKNSLFLLADDGKICPPERLVPGGGYRGALSYAFARGMEGAADADGDGTVTVDEIFDYVRQVAHEISGDRQSVALHRPAAATAGRAVVAEVTRGISVHPVGAAQSGGGGLTILSASPPDDKPAVAIFGAPDRPAAASPDGDLVKLASLDGRALELGDLPKTLPVKLVAPSGDPDIVWDPNSHDVLSGGDVIAHDVSVADLAGVVDRTLVLDGLKRRAAQHAQDIRLLPGDDVHAKGTRVEIDVGKLNDRYLVLFDLAGNGAAQLLYPLGSDPPQRTDADYSAELQVREPFGADLIVAVTAKQRLGDLERLLQQSARRLDPLLFRQALSQSDSAGLKIGFVGLFTAP